MSFKKGLITLLITISLSACSKAIDDPVTNIAPVANAGSDQSINENTTVNLSGSMSDDSDGNVVSYSWAQVSGDTVTLSDSSIANPSFTAPIAKVETVLGFELTVTDDDGDDATDTMTVTVLPVNAAPTSEAGDNLIVDERSSVSILGSGTDSDGNIATYVWEQTAGTPSVQLSDANTQTLVFTAPEVDSATDLEFTLTVTDDEGGTATDSMTLTINNVNLTPIADAGADQSVDEQTETTLLGVGSDTDGTIDSYNWTQISGDTVTLSDSNIANPSFTAPIAKVETILGFELTVTDDSGSSATDQIEVTVNPVNEINFTINGKVTGAAANIFNAEVNLSIGNLSLDAITNAEGEYSILVNADEALGSELVVLTATGTGTQSFIKLVSAGFNLQELMTLAGNDAILEATEYTGVNISNITTAIVARAQIGNNGIFPRTKEELEAYITNTIVVVAEADTLQTAVAIRLVVDNALTEPRLALPAGVTDTYQLASDPDRAVLENYFLNALNTTELSEIYSATLQEVLNNTDTQSAISNMPEVYLADLVGFVEEEGATSSENVSFNFNPDGTGTFRLKKVERNFTWQNANTLQIDMNDAIINTITRSEFIGGQVIQDVVRETIYESIEITLIATLGNVDLARYKVNWRHHYPNNELPDATQTPYDNVLYLFKEYQPLTQDDVISERALPLYADIVNTSIIETPTLEMAIFNFNEDGTVVFEKPIGAVTDLNFDNGTWALTSEDTLVLTFTEVLLEVHKLANNYFVTFALDNSNNYISSSMDYSVIKNDNSTWTPENIAGVYTEPGFLASPFVSFYGFELNADGTGQNIFADDIDGSGVLEPGEFTMEALTWVLQDDGKLVINSMSQTNTVDLLKIEGDTYNVLSRIQNGSAPTFEIDDQKFDLWIRIDSSPIN